MAGCCFARLCHTTAASQREGGGGADSEANGGSGLLDTSKGGRRSVLCHLTLARSFLSWSPSSQDARGKTVEKVMKTQEAQQQ